MTEEKKTSEKVGKIFKQIPLIMADIKAIGKEQRNTQQGFAYRGIDDVYNELQQHLSRHKVFSVPVVLEQKEGIWKTSTGKDMMHRALKIRYDFFAEDGSCISAVVMGEALDMGDKCSSKAMAIAHKYALFQIFCIPTDETKDPDSESHEASRQNGNAPGSLAHAKERQAEQAQGKPPREAIPVPMNVDGKMVDVDYYHVLDMFKNAKVAIGVERYYKILGTAGYEKSNLIPKANMNQIYQDMREEFRNMTPEEKVAAQAEEKKADPPKETKDKDKKEYDPNDENFSF